MQHFTDEQIISLFRNCRWYERRLENLRNQEVKNRILNNEVLLARNNIEEYYEIFAILDIKDQYKEWKEDNPNW